MLEGTERGRGFSVLQNRVDPRPASFPVLFAAAASAGVTTVTLRPEIHCCEQTDRCPGGVFSIWFV